MEHLNMAKTTSGLNIKGFPGAVKVIRLDTPKSKSAADLALHNTDLAFAKTGLESMNDFGLP